MARNNTETYLKGQQGMSMKEKPYYTKEESCQGKVAFDDPRTARKAASRMKHRVHYKCAYCNKWHVGRVGKNR